LYNGIIDVLIFILYGRKIIMITIVIPSLNPDEKLMMVVKSLVDKGFTD